MKQDKGILLILVLLFLCLLPFFYLHQGVLLVDTGREFFIPSQMLNGNVLFKDIFNIYGALSYQFNAVLFMIFGQNINVLAVMGAINSLIILVTLYFLAREFLNKSLSFLFTVFIMFALVFQTFLYNSNLTYCFAIVYALSSFLLSLLFLIKYVKTEKPKFAYLSCFFAGVSIANKYEFIFYLLVLIYALKNLGLKNALKGFGCFIIVPFISYFALLLQGLNLSDIKISAELISNLVNAPMLKQFFFKTSVAVFHNHIFGIFAILPILNVILLILFRKEIYKNKALFIFVLCAITASAKTFFSLNVYHMGLFMLPVCTLAMLCMLNIKFQRILTILAVAGIFLFASEDFLSLNHKDYYLETSKGNVYTYHKDGSYIKHSLDFIKNTKPTDRVVVMPEGSIINFLSDRNGDNMYYNLSPLFYYNVFGEERIISHFEKNLPEYFIILPIDNIEYGYRYFGTDYAQNFYEMINKNYNLIQEDIDIKIFKKKEI